MLFIYLVLHQPIIKGDTIPLYVNHLTPSFHHSSKQGKTATYVYSYDYYYPKFHFCTPKGGAKKQLESLGSIIFVIEFSIHLLKSKCWKQNLVNHYVLPNILNQIQYLSIEILELVILTIDC